MTTAEWLTDLPTGREEARTSKRPLLVDFWDPECLGCKKMIAVTFPDSSVARLLRERFVCVKIDTAAVPESAREFFRAYRVTWTPDLVFFDSRGAEMNRRLGYHTPAEFVAVLRIALGMNAMAYREYGAAFTLFTEASRVDGDREIRPEALFWAGIAAFKIAKSDRAILRQHWRILRDEYRATMWWSRAEASWGVEDAAVTV